jgi:cytochrome c biogenesis protein CcmG/thiol:disulfide interchange protein DsbE
MKNSKVKLWLSNIIFWGAIIFVAYKNIPQWLNGFNQSGKRLETKSYQLIGGENLEFPKADQKSIIIFWASWCGPCKLEMNRLKSSVEKNLILKTQIFAINPFENQMQIKKFFNNPYPFQFIDAPDIANQLNVSATPTNVFLDGQKVQSMSTGISLVGIWRAEYFVKD